MFSCFFGNGKSRCADRSAWIECLEGRRLLSASSIDADVLGLDTPPAARNFSPTNLVAQSVNPIKVEGTFLGHYVSAHIGKDTLVFTITHCTHTGHFVGSVTINTTAVGTLSGTVKGVVKVSKHIDVSVSGSDFTALFSGTASHTGGSFYGSYSITGSGKAAGLSDTGTYHVGKA